MKSPNVEPVETIVVVNNEIKEENLSKGRKLRNKRDDLLHGTKNKSIQKKKASSSNPAEFKTERQAEKYYLNINKNIKVKPIPLETIFEENEETDDSVAVQKQLGKASKRTLKIKDGLKNKTLSNIRKNKIKRKLGARKQPKKVALKKFVEDFKKKTSASE